MVTPEEVSHRDWVNFRSTCPEPLESLYPYQEGRGDGTWFRRPTTRSVMPGSRAVLLFVQRWTSSNVNVRLCEGTCR